MKIMIEEFAIFANSFVGAYLKTHLNTGIFRACDAKDWLKSINIGMDGKDMLQDIIQNGIQEYVSSIQSQFSWYAGILSFYITDSSIIRLHMSLFIKIHFYKPQYPHINSHLVK